MGPGDDVPGYQVHCNTYKSHTDARFRFFGAPGRFRGSFPDIHHAKVEISTPESFGQAVKAQVEFKPLQPLKNTALRVALDVGDLLNISGAGPGGSVHFTHFAHFTHTFFFCPARTTL